MIPTWDGWVAALATADAPASTPLPTAARPPPPANMSPGMYNIATSAPMNPAAILSAATPGAPIATASSSVTPLCKAAKLVPNNPSNNPVLSSLPASPPSHKGAGFLSGAGGLFDPSPSPGVPLSPVALASELFGNAGSGPPRLPDRPRRAYRRVASKMRGTAVLIDEKWRETAS